MDKHNLKRTAKVWFTGMMSVITALSPVVSVLPLYAADDTNDTVSSITADSSAALSSDEIEVSDVENAYTISIDLASSYGEVAVRSGTEEVQIVRVDENSDGERVSSVADDDGTLVSQTVLTEENPYVLVLTEEPGTVVTVQAKADNGYEVAQYSILMDSGDDISTEEIPEGFEAGAYASFRWEVTADADKVITIDFEDAANGAAEDTDWDDSITVEEEDSDGIEIVSEDTETEKEAVVEYGNEISVETGIVDEYEVEQSKTSEHFLDELSRAAELDSADFETMRLVILADADTIIDMEHVIGEFDGIYLMQYGSVEQTKNAYVYYQIHAQAVEPDKAVATASEADIIFEESEVPDVTADENPISALTDAEDSAAAQKTDKVIALIDTGVQDGEHVIDQISLIDDVMYGGTHGDDMAASIVSQNADAKILSIRAMNDNGYGTISSIVAAMEYAINQKVDMINLSLYAKKTLTTSVLEAEIDKAVDAGIMVVGAAGNSGDDASGYVPGSAENAYVIGACNENGVRLLTSNYGDNVDYYIVAQNTSEAAALFTGFVSANSLLDVTDFDLLKTEISEPLDTDIEISAPEVTEKDSEDALYDAVIENYVKENADPEYTAVDKIELKAALIVKNSLVDANELQGTPKIKDIFETDAISAFISQIDATTAVYNLSDDSDYFVSYADTMHNDKTSEVIDTVMANNNMNGEDFSDYHYDKATGLVYIPKSHFVDSEGTFLIDAVQIQLLQKMYLDDSFTVGSVVTSVVDDNEEVSAQVVTENAHTFATNVVVEKGLDVDTLVVSVNGLPIPDSVYSYNPLSGSLGLSLSSAGIQNIAVYCDGRDYDQEAAATAYTYASMPYVNDASAVADIDFDNIDKSTVYSGTADVLYGSQAATYTNSYQQNSAANTINYILGNSNSISGEVTQQTVLMNFAIDLSSIDLGTKDPVDWDSITYKSGGRLGLNMECAHPEKELGISLPSSLSGGPILGNYWFERKIIMRPLDVGTDYVVWGVITQTMNSQNGYGLFKLRVTPTSGGLKIKKTIIPATFTQFSERVRVNTTFELYTGYDSTEKDVKGKKVTVDGVSEWSCKGDSNKASETVTITGLDPGTYYIKETKQCPGCVINTSIYKAVVKEGKTTKEYVNMNTGNDVNKIINEACRGVFEFHKQDTEGNPVEGVIFKVEMYDRKIDSSYANNDKRATWYFKSDANGVVKYDSDHFVETWTGPKGNVNTSTTPCVYGTNNTWALPACVLYITEVYAPEGYKITDTSTHEVALSPTKADDDMHYEKVISKLVWDGNTYDADLGEFYTFVNEKDDISISVNKGIGTTYSAIAYLNGKLNPLYADLSGAVYEVHDAATGALVNDKETGEPAILTTTSDGTSNTVKLPNEDHSYYLIETAAPKNYRLDSKTKWNFTTVKNSETATVYVTDDPVYDMQFAMIKKQDPVTGSWTNSVGTQDLSTARFRLSYWAEEPTDATRGTVPTRTADMTWVYKPDADGYIDIMNPDCLVSGTPIAIIYGHIELPVGTYYLEEIQAGYGFRQDKIDQVKVLGYMEFVMDANGGHAESNWCDSVIFTNESDDMHKTLYESGALYTDIYINKSDIETGRQTAQGDGSLAGIEFRIRNMSKDANGNGRAVIVNGVSYPYGSDITGLSLVTDKSGYADTVGQAKDKDGNVIGALPVGEYTIREISTNDSYLLTDGSEHTFSISMNAACTEAYFTSEPDGQYQIDMDDGNPKLAYSFSDQVVQGGIELTKHDAEMKSQTAQGESTLEGAEFTIINASIASVINKDGDEIAAASVSANPTYTELRKIADAGKNTVQIITTDKNGEAATGEKDLPYGTYYIIETKSSYGYWIDKTFIGKIVIRDDGKVLGVNTTVGNSSFTDLGNGENGQTNDTVDQIVRRKDLQWMKVNIDGEYKPYIPFLISAIRVNDDGTETVLESHVIVSDANGQVNTSASARPRNAETVNGFDKYVVNGKVTEEGEKYLQEASTWGVWFQGNATDYPKDALNNTDGALYTCHYRITELQCNDNKDLGENLEESELLYIYNDTGELDALMSVNNPVYTYHPLVDTEIEMTSKALDVESNTKTVPARESVEVTDTITYTHVDSTKKYRMETQFIDITDNNKVLKILGTNTENATVSEDGAWLLTEFSPEKKSGTDTTYGEMTVSAMLNTKELNGHTIMAVDYLYQYVDISYNDAVPGNWILVKTHPNEGEVDENQCLYVPDLHTTASDVLTGDRTGAKSADDAIHDTVRYKNLSTNETYAIVMTLKDAKTGEYISVDEDGNPIMMGIDTKTGLIYKSSTKEKTPYGGTVEMKDFALDSSGFKDGQTVVVVEYLYRADGETGELLGEPIMVHDSILDEDQTIRWVDVGTSASDKNTADDVGTDESDAIVYDQVTLTNVIFDDNDHEDGSGYSYSIKGHLVYQKDFTDANGVEHKAGDIVETLDGTQDVVTITCDAAGNAAFTYADGTAANGTVTITGYGMNVANSLTDNEADNSYITDNTAAIANVTVEMIYHVDSETLEGGTVVAYEYLYHDSTGGSETEVAKHEDITDKGQTVHYPKVRTSAVDDATKDDVGALREDASITDTVILTNLVPGRDYTVNGKLVEQENGEDFLVNGNTVTQSASIHVTEDGKIQAGNGENVTVTSYDKEKNEVCGTIDLVFTFDATGLEDRTCVVFEDLYHKDVKVAAHNDLTDAGQTVHFPKIRTTAADGWTEDHVGTVTEEAVIVDTVQYWNLVPGRTYTVSGVLMNKDTLELLLDANGNQVTAERTFTAGEKGDGIVITEMDDDHNKVSGTIDLTFTFDASLLENTTVVAFEDLYHNKIKVTAHADIQDEDQTVHFPKLRTSAIDRTVGDEVGQVGNTVIVDTVTFWNLVPGMTYEISGILMDKETAEPIEIDGKQVVQKATITVHEDGSVTAEGGERTEVTNYDEENNFVDGMVELTYELDASTLEGKSVVVFEDLYHNGVKVTSHADINDLGQTIHFPKIRTTAVDVETQDNAGTVTKEAKVVDRVKYTNLVVGKEYTIKGTLMNQETGVPIVNQDGTLVTAQVAFTATAESSELNKVTAYDENNMSVDGEYTLTFTLDSRALAGKTVVVFEDLYHNDVKVTTHSDLYDDSQSVHYPQIHTTALDSSTGDHVGSIWGAFINGIRHLLGETDADGNGIPDEKQANIIDTVTLTNLVPGLTYVVSGKLYDAGASAEAEEPVELLIDGEAVIQAVTITVAEDGKTITASDGSETKVTSFDKETNCVNGSVELTYTLDSSKIQGVEVVVFEDLYQDAAYTPDTNPAEVDEKDIIHTHSDWTDKGQSVSEVGIQTTAVDTKTEGHVGAEPMDTDYSVIHDTVNLTKLVPGMEYTIKGVLVDIAESDFENSKVLYLKADGTVTDERDEAYEETYTFTAEEESETYYLNFVLTSDKVQGRALTVFEDIWHNDVKISSHPAGDADGWDEESFANQTVYYPTGKTNATDDMTGQHTGLAAEDKIITDRVYFENLLVGEEYEIEGQLMYQEDFIDANGVEHKAGEPLNADENQINDNIRRVKFVASEDLTEAAYVDEDGSAVVDSVTVTTYANGQKAISGYVSLSFAVNAKDLAGATVVAFETFYNNDVPVFVHKNLNDLPQTVRIPKIQTSAKSLDLDEASVYDENGEFRDIEIVDTVTYENLWTPDELAQMAEQGKKIIYADGTIREQDSNIYDITDAASYVLKGVLMDKETGEPLLDADGKEYVVYSEPFVPEAADGSYDMTFSVNAGDFVKDGECSLEGKSIVVFEDLYQTGDVDNTDESTHVATHHDIDDAEQDIRFPKGRTHATDGVPEDILEDLTEGQIAALEAVHDGETVTTGHEVYATEDITITDMVAFENLHGRTKYTITGTLQVVTEFDENGAAIAWEEAKDDDGNVITVTEELDTTQFSEDYDANVSGYIPLTFKFSGVTLANKVLVAFETISREGVLVAVHADITDASQTVFIPQIHTNASDALTGLDETLAGSDTVILDKVTYENLEAGKTYTLKGVLHKKADGSEMPGAVVEGTFVAGTENQFIMVDGTKVMTLDELRESLGGVKTKSSWSSSTSESKTGDSDVTDDSSLDTNNKVEYVVGKDIQAGYYKITPGKTNTGDYGYWCIYYSEDGSVPTERTAGTTLTNGIVHTGEADYIRLEDNMVLQLAAWCNTGYEKVSASVGEANLNKTVKAFFDKKAGVNTEDAVNTSIDTASEETQTDAEETQTDAVKKGSMTKRVSGEVYVVIPVDATDLAGETMVAFETLYAADENGGQKEIAAHEDIDDEEQSVKVPTIATSAVVDGEKQAAAGKKTTVVDTVTYHNLTPGREYVMSGVLMDKTTGKSTEMMAEQPFTPKETDGTVEVTFTLDSTGLAGRQLVVFEELRAKDDEGNAYVVAEHKDINDNAQTVTIQQPSEDKAVPHIDTGDIALTGCLLGAAIMIMMLGILYKRRQKSLI